MSPQEDSTLATISVTLAQHGVILENLSSDLRDIKATQKEHQARSDALLVQNATIVARIDNVTSSQLAQQGQINGLLQWQLSEMTQRGVDAIAINEKVNAASILATAKVEEHKDSSNARIIAAATTAIVTIVGIIWGIVQIYLSTHPGH